MSLIHELSRTTAQTRRETERLVDPLIAKEKERFTQECRMAARNERNQCQMVVHMNDEVKERAGGKNVTEQKLRAMLVELGFHDGSVERLGPHYFLVGATWPVADAADQASTKRRRRTSPHRAGGTFITCPICHEHRPAVVLMPCGHVVCRDCQRCQQFRQCPMCRGPVSSASNGLFMDWRPRPCCPAVGGWSCLRWKLQADGCGPVLCFAEVGTQCISEVACSQLPAAKCQQCKWHIDIMNGKCSADFVFESWNLELFCTFPFKQLDGQWNSYGLGVALAERNLHFTWPPSNYECSFRGIDVWWLTSLFCHGGFPDGFTRDLERPDGERQKQIVVLIFFAWKVALRHLEVDILSPLQFDVFNTANLCKHADDQTNSVVLMFILS